MVNNNFIADGDKIFLRKLQLSDVNNEYLNWLNDPEVMKGISTSGYDFLSLKSYVKDKISNKNVHFYAIVLKSNNQHIGNIKLDFHDSISNVSELGVLIGNKNYWGKGIAKEACDLVLDYGFNVLKLRKIFLAVFENNVAAIKLYKSIGFKLEGKLKKHISINGSYYDKYFMGIFRNNYMRK